MYYGIICVYDFLYIFKEIYWNSKNSKIISTFPAFKLWIPSCPRQDIHGFSGVSQRFEEWEFSATRMSFSANWQKLVDMTHRTVTQISIFKRELSYILERN